MKWGVGVLLSCVLVLAYLGFSGLQHSFLFDADYCVVGEACGESGLFPEYEFVKVWSYTGSGSDKWAALQAFEAEKIADGYICKHEQVIDSQSGLNGNPTIVDLYSLCFCSQGIGFCGDISPSSDEFSFFVQLKAVWWRFWLWASMLI